MYINFTGDTFYLKPANCLRAVEMESGVIILWSKFLDKKSMFSLAEDNNCSEELCVTRFPQLKEVPNIDHTCGVCVMNGSIYVHDRYAK